jgi:hypothetical protein
MQNATRRSPSLRGDYSVIFPVPGGTVTLAGDFETAPTAMRRELRAAAGLIGA